MTTKRSYEDQLSMMSDHLCSMNETLTKQREEIDTLKMTSKVSCPMLTAGTGCRLELCGLHLAFLQYYPLTNQFTSSSSVSASWNEKSTPCPLHFGDKILATHTCGKEETLYITVGFQYPLMEDQHLF